MSITSTLIFQMIVFLILVGFTMKYIWPPITAALDARAKKIADGLSAADKAKAELAIANKRVEEQLSAARDDAAKRLADAERLAQSMIEDAKGRAARKAPRSSLPPRPRPPRNRSRHVRRCATRSPHWPSRAPSRSCARKSTPASTPPC